MKTIKLDKEEQELLHSVENGEWVSVEDLDQVKKEAIQIAKNTLKKTRNINIRLSEKDLLKIKAKAVENGIPYQTLVSSILHRFANKTTLSDLF